MRVEGSKEWVSQNHKVSSERREIACWAMSEAATSWGSAGLWQKVSEASAPQGVWTTSLTGHSSFA